MKPTTLFPWIVSVILSIVLMSSIKQCNNNKDKADDLAAQNLYWKTSIDSITNKIGQVVAESKVAQTNSAETIRQLSSNVFQLQKNEEKRIKEVQTLVRLMQNFKLDSVFIPFIDTVNVSDTGMIKRNQVVIPPKQFKDSTKNYVIAGTVLLSGVRLDDVSISDTVSFRIAEKAPKGFINRIFKSNETVIQSIHTNPIVKTTGQQSITLKSRPNAWNRWIKPLLFGAGGVFLGSKVVK
jgi:hypothetical protein